MEVKGKFNAKRFYDTLAAILSDKYGVRITATVQELTEQKKEKEKTA